ncbi:MAG TPA: nitroreductase family protein [Anaerolineales bacterium]|nr:nitroreductase family protein [Anaerolineales bacterium]
MQDNGESFTKSDPRISTSTTDLHHFLRTRRSIRRFKPDPVPDSVIERILTTATHAPSAHNTQPWRFAIVAPASRNTLVGSTARERLACALTTAMRRDMTAEGASEAEIEKRVANSIRRINEAPVLIVLCRDVTAVREHKREDEIMSIQSVANAATYLLLAAHAEGLGGNWICWPLYAQEETRAALNLPATWEPQAMVFIGYANETPKEKLMKPLDEIVAQV